MPQVFFDVDDGQSIAQDKTGLEVASLAGLRREVVNALYDLFRDRVGDEDSRVFEIAVRDDHNTVILTASLAFNVRTFGKLGRAGNGLG